MGKIYKCKKCECNDIYAKPCGRRLGAYCTGCNAFIDWITYEEVAEIQKNNKISCVDNNVAIKKFFKRSGITTIRCSKCECLLYNSLIPKIEGQFDLVNAKFCPKCGRELV